MISYWISFTSCFFLSFGKHLTGFLFATYESSQDWRWQAPPSSFDRQMGAWPSPPKARGRFRAGLHSGPLRWMRDRGLAATNRPPPPPFWGWSARRGGAAVSGNDVHPSVSGWACQWMGGLFIDDDAIVPSSVLNSLLDGVAMVPDSRKQSVCFGSLFFTDAFNICGCN